MAHQIRTAAVFNFFPCIFSTLCILKQFLPEVVNRRLNILFSGMNNLKTKLDEGSVGIKIRAYLNNIPCTSYFYGLLVTNINNADKICTKSLKIYINDKQQFFLPLCNLKNNIFLKDRNQLILIHFTLPVRQLMLPTLLKVEAIYFEPFFCLLFLLSEIHNHTL